MVVKDPCKLCVYGKFAGTSTGCCAPDYVPTDKCENEEYYSEYFKEKENV